MTGKIIASQMVINIVEVQASNGIQEDLAVERITGFPNPPPVNASVIMKIYRSKLINEILNATSIDEVRSNITENILQIKKQDIRGNEFTQYITYIIEELNDLKGSTLAKEYYMNLAGAGIYLNNLLFPIK